jgi:HEAT repeat protein/predicted MPP superfamily phosphohydrolase
MVNWSRYLESLCNTYAQWWQVYTITEVVGRQRVESQASPRLFDFGLMVQTVEQDREERGKGEEKIERLSMLEGLHKYASQHVLLVGRPGSGKSTALVRLLEEGERCRGAREAGETLERTPLNPPLVRGEEDLNSLAPPLIRGVGGVKIPVLVELRYYRTSILDLIQDFLQRHDPNLTVDAETLKSWLRQGQLLLLVDGLNELPSEEARRDLQKFRQDYQRTTPMIFTTRDLGVGGDLDIAKKLEMQPLSEAQMQEFVRAYLPQQGEQMLRQLGSRLRELGQTPLLLWMLCSLFKTIGKVPPNLGLVFRQFAQSYYDKLKQDIPISDESRRWCQLSLQHLAWRMTQGREATELQVAISRQEAEEILTAYLRNEGFAQPRNRAMEWLADLLKYHLLQLGTDNQIEFRHQLIQEHCAAESLLKLLPSLSDDELKRDYLNYLKWTEPLALMLELVEDEAQAVRVVKLALNVDLRLGARLAGAVKPKWQEQTVGLVAGLEISQLLKIQLLNLAKYEEAILELVKALNHQDSYIRRSAAYDLANIVSDATIEDLVKTLNYKGSYARWSAAYTLGKIGSHATIKELVKALNDKDSYVRMRAADALGEIGSDVAIEELVKALKDENSDVHTSAAYALGKIGSHATIEELVKALNDKNSSIRTSAAYALGKIGSHATIEELVKALNDEDSSGRVRVAEPLGKIGSHATIEELVKALNDKDSSIRMRAAEALEKVGSDVAIKELVNALNHQDYSVRSRAANALRKIGSDVAIKELVSVLKDEDSYVRSRAAEALGKIGSDAAIPELVSALKDEDSYVRSRAAEALGKIGSHAAVEELVNVLSDEDYDVRSGAAEALGKIGSDAAIAELVNALNDKKYDVRRRAAEALVKIASPELLPDLSLRLKTDKEPNLLDTISAIQNRCKFYNYTLTQPNSASGVQSSQIPLTLLKKGDDIQSISIKLMHILHLSDLHFGILDQANLWSNQLAADLYNDRNISHLDALILSGDIANYSTPEEYEAAEQFLHNLRQDFPLNPEQIILVPGNHDLNWKLAEEAYRLERRKNYKGELREGSYIDKGDIIEVRDEEDYKQRFAHFSQFYETIKQKPYPLDYDQQYTLDHLKEQNLLILGLNSAWQLDHHYKSRASINTNALSNALTKIRHNRDYDNCLKIAVWHHPLNSAWEDRITDHGFTEQLAVAGFRLYLHGHIHKAETSPHPYDLTPDGRKLDRICAGTFGARPDELNYGYPWQYNLLKIEDNQLTVYTRRREELNGAWKPDARWLQGAGKTPLDYYAIAL